MSADDEASWRLLYGIALSHGEALETKQLAWEGWMVFLSSAALMGTPTGIYPVLLDQLWQRQALSAEEAARLNHLGGNGSDSTSSSSFNEVFFRNASDALASGTSPTSTASHAGVVGFGGFVDMMKVLCVRVYQASQLASLREKGDHHGDAFLTALRRCAEDCVLLTEAVHFTASHYLRPFIARSTIHATSRVSLRASRNRWAPHVNRLLTHIVGSLTRDVILPIYRTYADDTTGRLGEEGFRAFVSDYLPALSAVEETCARAIFAHGGFADIRPLLQALLGTPSPVSSSAFSSTAVVAAVPTLGLTDFMEALLMLSVVVSADEARDPHLRPITAKAWVFFDRFLCHGRCGGAMCANPYLTGRYVAMLPGLVCVFPPVVPLLPCPSLLVEVCNATPFAVGGSATTTTAASRASAAPPRRQAGEDQTPFLTEVTTLEAANATSLVTPTARTKGSAAGDVAVEAASPFFASQWSLLERNADVPLFGDGGATTGCQVTVGGTVVTATKTSSREAWKVSLAALALDSVKLVRCAVEAAAVQRSGDGEEGSVRLIFTPIRSLPVELVVPEQETSWQALAKVGGNSSSSTVHDAAATAAAALTPWGCKDVVFTDTPVTQVVSVQLVQQVRDMLTAAQAQSSGEGATAGAVSEASYSLADLGEVCRRLQWCAAEENGRPAGVEALCSQALTSYRQFQRTLCSCGPQRASPQRPPSSTGAAAPSALTMEDVVGCMSVLLFRTNSGVLCDIPNVPRRLELALLAATAAAAAAPPSTGTSTNAAAAAAVRTLPHNRLRDEPFKLALERKGVQSAAAQERRAALIKALCEHHAKQVSSPVALPLLPETRPNAMRLVSQYGNVDPAADFQKVMMEGAETIKAHFVERELSIPEWQSS